MQKIIPRRLFVKNMIKGIAFTSSLSSSSKVFANQPNKVVNNKNIKIGIIGAENSHTRGFGKIFNIDKKFPGVEVKYVWGETNAAWPRPRQHYGRRR